MSDGREGPQGVKVFRGQREEQGKEDTLHGVCVGTEGYIIEGQVGQKFGHNDLAQRRAEARRPGVVQNIDGEAIEGNTYFLTFFSKFIKSL